MVEQWSSKSHTWVRFLLLLSIKNLFYKKIKNFVNPLNFFKIINVKTRKPALFLTGKTRKYSIEKENFTFSKSALEQFFFKNENSKPPYSLFFKKNIKSKKKYFCENIFLFYNFTPLTDYFLKFYNFFLVNNFLFNATLINFFKSSNFKKTDSNVVKSLFKKKKWNFDFKKKKEIFSDLIFFNKKKTPSSFFSKFLLKTIRNVARKTSYLLFFLSKNFFNNKSSLNTYFKKYQTLAFQLDRRETLSTKLLKVSKMSKKLDKFQFIIPKSANTTKKHTKYEFDVLAKMLKFSSMSNQLDNFFFHKFYSKKNNNYFFLNRNKSYKYCSKFFKNPPLILKKNTHARFLSAVSSVLSKINRSVVKKKNYKLMTYGENSNLFKNCNHFFKKFNIFNFFFFFEKPFFFKIIICDYSLDSYKNIFNFSNFFFKKQYKTFFFQNQNILLHNNLLPSSSFFYIYKKKILKLFQYDKFSPVTAPFCINSIIRFFEHCSGKSVIFKINLHLNRLLSYYEKSQCFNWSLKVKVFRKMLGPRLFLAESLEILYLTFKLKDPFFLSNWLLGMLKKISFWKYRLFFRYLKYVLRFFFFPIFKELDVKGIKFQLKGKISVAGNARTRTLLQKTGVTGHSSFNNKIVSELSLVPSFTGVMGLRVWIFF